MSLPAITRFSIQVSMVENEFLLKQEAQANEKSKLNANQSLESNKIPDIPISEWKKFPSYDIPALFNYGHVYFYALESISAKNDPDQTSVLKSQ